MSYCRFLTSGASPFSPLLLMSELKVRPPELLFSPCALLCGAGTSDPLDFSLRRPELQLRPHGWCIPRRLQPLKQAAKGWRTTGTQR